MVEIIPNWHPIFVHFTVALLSVAILLSVVVAFLSAGKLRQQWQLVAQWNLWLGAGFTLLTVAAGVVAYNTVAHDTPSHEAMTEHRNWALVTAALFIALAIGSWQRARADKAPGGVLLAGLLIGGVLLAATAWHGGELVYRHGLGVKSLPKASAHSHAGGEHDHEHDHAHATLPATSPEQATEGVECELPEDKAGATPATTAADHPAEAAHEHDHEHVHEHEH